MCTEPVRQTTLRRIADIGTGRRQYRAGQVSSAVEVRGVNVSLDAHDLHVLAADGVAITPDSTGEDRGVGRETNRIPWTL